MSKIIIIGAGAMGSAFTIPCIENGNDVTLIGTHLENNLIDEIHLFKAPITIGKKGIPVIEGNDLKNIKKKLLEKIKFDDNLYFKYEIK